MSRTVRASVMTWPPSMTLAVAERPILSESAVVPVKEALEDLWWRLPPVLAAAQPQDRFVFSVGFLRDSMDGEVSLFMLQNVGVGTLVGTLARKLARQQHTAQAQAPHPSGDAVEIHGPEAERVLAELEHARKPRDVIPWVDPMYRGGR